MGGLASLANQFGGLASMAGVRLEKGGAGLEAQAVLRSRRLVEEFVKRNDLMMELRPHCRRAADPLVRSQGVPRNGSVDTWTTMIVEQPRSR